MRHHLMPVRMVTMKKKKKEITNVGKNAEKREPLCTVDRHVNWWSHYENSMEVPQNIKPRTSIVVVQLLSCVQLCDPMDCNTPGFSILHYLLEFAQIIVHWVGDAIQPSHPLLPSSTISEYLSEENKNINWERYRHPHVPVALFTIDEIWKQPKCPLVDEYRNCEMHTYTNEYYSVIKSSEISPCAVTQVGL